MEKHQQLRPSTTFFTLLLIRICVRTALTAGKAKKDIAKMEKQDAMILPSHV